MLYTYSFLINVKIKTQNESSNYFGLSLNDLIKDNFLKDKNDNLTLINLTFVSLLYED